MKNLSLANVRSSRRWRGMPLIFLLSLIVTIGCTTVVTLLKPGAVTSLEQNMRAIMGDRAWPPMVAQLGAPERSPMVLTLQTQGTQLTSPP